jgi:hypothetical protein
MTSIKEEVEVAIDAATRKAERAIQGILLNLEHDTRRRVGHVRADTRNFANYAVEILLEK